MSNWLSELVQDAEGYLVKPDTQERVIFYECDPAKNFLCTRCMCRGTVGGEDEGEVGYCSSTPEAAFRKDGGRAFYKKWNGEYYGREYINEEG